MKTLDTFDFTSTDGSINAVQIAELARGEWIKRADNVILAGPIGTGKTHLAIGLGVEAARQRLRVLFTRAADVVRMLLEARDARELGRLQRKLHQVDLLVLDEHGFVPFDKKKSSRMRKRGVNDEKSDDDGLSLSKGRARRRNQLAGWVNFRPAKGVNLWPASTRRVEDPRVDRTKLHRLMTFW